MMETIEQYLEIIREIIVKKSAKGFYNDEFNEMMEKQLKIKENQIEIILSSIDVIGDSQEAINNFYLFGLKLAKEV